MQVVAAKPESCSLVDSVYTFIFSSITSDTSPHHPPKDLFHDNFPVVGQFPLRIIRGLKRF